MVEEKCSGKRQSNGLSRHVWLWVARVAVAVIVVLVFRPVILQEGLVPFVFGVVIVNFVIVVHELGHLLAALSLQVPVEAFSVGLGPAWASKRWRDIDWRLSLIPFGGFVELGECVREKHRFLVAAAGPITSLLFGFLAMFIAGMLGGVSRKVVTPLMVAHTSPVARTAGLQPGDVLVSVEGQEVKERFTIELKKARASDKSRLSVSVVVRRGDTRMSMNVPVESAGNGPRLGVKFRDTAVKLPAGEALFIASKATGALAAQPVLLPALLLTRPRTVSDSVTGPGGVLQIASYAYASSPAYWLFMVGLLSGAIGGFQLLPLVPLDGGRMVEAVLRRVLRKANVGVQISVITLYSTITFVLALLLAIVGLTRDIFR